jgi:hypothetical protein
MSERAIFLNALDREDSAERAAYLDVACIGRPELRRRIERLLQLHQVKDTFLEVSAPEQLARGEQALPFLAPAGEPGSLGRLDHYEVLAVVGRGGTGVVLKALDTKLRRVVAVKVLAPQLAASGTARRRFVREARAAAAVRDDHVVDIHAVQDDGAVPYLVMEYVAGVTLQERIETSGPLELKEVLRIGQQAASGLAAAHAQGLIHRDVKPANILLENGVERVKITDFGLARAADDASLSQSGVITGTPLYMSPEQARGDAVDHRTDLFSLGSVLYALCTGRPPFRATTTMAVLKRVCEDAPRPIRQLNPDVPEWLCAIIGKLHAKDAKGRFAAAREVADLLSGHLARLQQPPSGPQPPAGQIKALLAYQAAVRPSAVPSSRRRRFLAVACLAGLLAALAALAVYLKPWQRQGPQAGHQGRPRVARRPLRRGDRPARHSQDAGDGAGGRARPRGGGAAARRVGGGSSGLRAGVAGVRRGTEGLEEGQGRGARRAAPGPEAPHPDPPDGQRRHRRSAGAHPAGEPPRRGTGARRVDRVGDGHEPVSRGRQGR